MFTDDILMLVATDAGDGAILGTASVVFTIRRTRSAATARLGPVLRPPFDAALAHRTGFPYPAPSTGSSQ